MARSQTVILASRSPRRREILYEAGYHVRIEISEANEDTDITEPSRLVTELSSRKAYAVAASYADLEAEQEYTQLQDMATRHEIGYDEEQIIIGADTVVSLEGEILGKPKDEENAVTMLRRLSGKIHQVYTGVTVLRVTDGILREEKHFYDCTDVEMRDIREEEIARYVASGEPMDKAGAYGIQGRAGKFIRRIQGDYYNVVGLPICRLSVILSNMHVELR